MSTVVDSVQGMRHFTVAHCSERSADDEHHVPRQKDEAGQIAGSITLTLIVQISAVTRNVVFMASVGCRITLCVCVCVCVCVERRQCRPHTRGPCENKSRRLHHLGQEAASFFQRLLSPWRGTSQCLEKTRYLCVVGGMAERSQSRQTVDKQLINETISWVNKVNKKLNANIVGDTHTRPMHGLNMMPHQAESPPPPPSNVLTVEVIGCVS